MNYAIITENDESEWNDETGVKYHYPSKYLSKLQAGTKIIYYKGKMKDSSFEKSRLTTEPHYFGIGEIVNQYIDQESSKNDHFSDITNYQPFDNAILIKDNNNQYLEEILKNRETNYWRDGVRPITKEVYDKILSQAHLTPSTTNVIPELTSRINEGRKIEVYSTQYERSPKLRQEALDIHGYTCAACGFDFNKTYGEIGNSFIHIHHIKPLFQAGEQRVNPETDLIPVCPNCHYMIHRSKLRILSIEELKEILKRES